jgi:hypothetical protein
MDPLAGDLAIRLAAVPARRASDGLGLGIRNAVLATLISTAAVWFPFLPPAGTFAKDEPRYFLSAGMFIHHRPPENGARRLAPGRTGLP